MTYINADLHDHGPEEWLDGVSLFSWTIGKFIKLVDRKLQVLGIAEMGEEDNRFARLRKHYLFSTGKEEDECPEYEIVLPEENLVIVRVQEIATRNKSGKPEGHVVVFGNKRKIPTGSLDEVANDANEQGAAVISDHSFCGPHPALIGVGYAKGEDKLLEYIDKGMIHAVEYNGQMASIGFINRLNGLRKANDYCLEFARKNRLKIVANSDAHSEREHPGSHTIFYVPSDAKPENYTEYVCAVLRSKDPDSRKCIDPVKIPAPAFSADEHALRIAGLVLLEKLGFLRNGEKPGHL